jgi:hypothetical protein
MLNGDRYEGEWINDSKEGYGVHVYSGPFCLAPSGR